MIPLLPNQNKREVDLEMMSHISRVAHGGWILLLVPFRAISTNMKSS